MIVKALNLLYNTTMVIRKQALKAPSAPGVYFFRNGDGRVIYIGKAANLRLRLLSYFRPDSLDPRKRAMVEEAVKLDWQETGSDIEALILESELIKKNRPKHNIVMRDDKRYFYVAFTKEKFPKIFITHQPKRQGGQSRASSWTKPDFVQYLGPFTDGGAIKSVLKMLQKAFPYCRCSGRKNSAHQRPCQQAELGRCLGVCCLKKEKAAEFYPDADELKKLYAQNVSSIKKVLSGRLKKILLELKKEMNGSARARNYEKAARARDQIEALENIFRHKTFLSRDDQSWKEKGLKYLADILGLKKIERLEAFDVSNIQGKMPVGSMVVFVNGTEAKNEYKRFRIRLGDRPNDPAMIKEIVERRLKHKDWPLPQAMIMDGGKTQLGAALFALRQHGVLSVKTAALAKREEELYLPPQAGLPDGRKIALKEGPEPLLHLLASLRNEAHRFAVSYHRKLRRPS